MPVANAVNAPAPRRPVIAVTSGEPAGIGPDLCAILRRARGLTPRGSSSSATAASSPRTREDAASAFDLPDYAPGAFAPRLVR